MPEADNRSIRNCFKQVVLYICLSIRLHLVPFLLYFFSREVVGGWGVLHTFVQVYFYICIFFASTGGGSYCMLVPIEAYSKALVILLSKRVLTLKAQRKRHLKMSSAANNCLTLLTN